MKTTLLALVVALSVLTALPTESFAAAQTATKTFALTVVAQLGITTVSLPNLTIGQAYSVTIQATGGLAPYTWSIDATTPLPTGLTMNSSTGVISGTVSSLPPSCTVGSPCSVSIKVNVTDSTP